MAIFPDVTFPLDMVRMARIESKFYTDKQEDSSDDSIHSIKIDDFLLPNLLEVLVSFLSAPEKSEWD